MEVLFFVPTYNERENLPELIRRLYALGLDSGVLIVDDESPDGTGMIADELARQFPRIEVMHRGGRRGRGLAGVAGLSRAAQMDAPLIIEMDADLSHVPEDAVRLVEAARDADVVVGSRYTAGGGVEGWGLYRKINSGVANMLSRVILGVRLRDATSGYRCFRREILRQLPWDWFISEGPSIVEEIMMACQRVPGCRIVETPITFVDRTRGTSKMTPRVVLKWIYFMLRMRLRRFPGAVQTVEAEPGSAARAGTHGR